MMIDFPYAPDRKRADPLWEHARQIMENALAAARPDRAVREALRGQDFGGGRLILIAAGKAAWQMADAACGQLDGDIHAGVVITKYGHSRGPLPGLAVFEAGHPVPDENSFAATRAAMEAVSGLTDRDTVLFLLSGGASALFEQSLIPSEDLQALTRQLLASGADIVEINTLRKRFSAVKGGRFAELCRPARVFAIALSDVLGDRADMIASGPVCPDPSTAEEAWEIVRRFGLSLTPQMEELLNRETPKTLDNAELHITGSVRQLCAAAEETCRSLGYETLLLTDQLSCTARDAGVFLANIAASHRDARQPLALIAGGETVVRLTGNGLGGRNQELALAAAPGLSGLNACLFSLGSDGTDGPTDAAGGIVDGESLSLLTARGLRVEQILRDNDAYHALQACGGLIVTGPTGTNVNDLSVLLLAPGR